MIEPFMERQLQNCRYNLTAGKAFLPESGEEELTHDRQGLRRLHWRIEPTETIVLQTREHVRIPSDVMGMYGQLNRLANKGLNLINESIIEPGYDGYLSCFLVNLSKQAVLISPGEEIAKITFHGLNGEPANLVRLQIAEDDYSIGLSLAAALYPRSFLDIESLQDKIVGKTAESVRTSITIGGIVLALLIAFSSIEPLFSRYLYERTGVVLDTSSAEVQRLRDEVNQLSEEQKTSKSVADLQKRLDDLSQRIDQLRGSK
jgi:deoxycytidine triphosphate deaminase